MFDLIVPPAGQDEAVRHQQRVLSGEAIISETERRRKDGTLVTVRVSAAQVVGDEEGRLLLLYTDMTAIRQTEAAMRAAQARLEMVLASSTAVIYATRVEVTSSIPSWISENLTRITGYEVAEALEPDWWYNHLYLEDRARVVAESPLLLAEDRLTIEYRFRQKDGRVRWLRDESRLIRDAQGRPQEVFGAWLDITDLSWRRTQCGKAASSPTRRPGPVGVPGQYEPRDPDPDERRAGPDGTDARHRALRLPAPFAAAGASAGHAAHPAQRHPRLLEDRSRAVPSSPSRSTSATSSTPPQACWGYGSAIAHRIGADRRRRSPAGRR